MQYRFADFACMAVYVIAILHLRYDTIYGCTMQAAKVYQCAVRLDLIRVKLLVLQSVSCHQS